MKVIKWVCFLFIGCRALAQPVQRAPVGTKIEVKDATAYAGRLVWVALQAYNATDNGQMLFVRAASLRGKRSLVLILTGAARKKLLADMAATCELNKTVKLAFDTTVNANGRVISYKGSPAILVGRVSHVYLGTDLKLAQP